MPLLLQLNLNLEGTFIEANDLFLDMTKYKLIEIIGSQTCEQLLEKDIAESLEYSQFWNALCQRNSTSAESLSLSPKDGY